MDKITKQLKVGVATFLITLAVGGIFYVGFKTGESNKPIKGFSVANAQQTLNADLSVFWEAIGIIKARYVNADKINDQDLLYGAVEGALMSLDDPYTEFYKPSDAKKLQEDLAGSFGGIGAELGMKNNQITIVAPLKGNPAEKAGIQAGDKIMKVDEKSTSGLGVEDAVKIIRGEPGTMVTLSIFREGWKEEKEFKIKREIIVVPTLELEMKQDGIAIIHLYNFNANAVPLFQKAVISAMLKGTKGIILDLRNNPGGFLDVATELSGWFLRRGETVLREKLQSGDERFFYSNGSGALIYLPTVVLVNNGSASASEIMAGALRDVRKIKLVGEKTFGKGSVQEVQGLSDGSTVKVTIAEWLTPKGFSINKKGIDPDVEIKNTDEDIKNKKDPQLDKAIEVLLSEINKKK